MPNRREFIKDAALISASISVAGCAKVDAKNRFPPDERECVIAMCEQIVPRDEFAGATDAGVINYVENWIFKYYPEMREIYADGTKAVERSSVQIYGAKFQNLTFAKQREFMKLLEGRAIAKSTWNSDVNQSGFFNEIRVRAMQGFYGSPRHGGNKDLVSYRMMGWDIPPCHRAKPLQRRTQAARIRRKRLDMNASDEKKNSTPS